ncbi:hypothetical protein [Burkholderia phage vB_BglM_WTB]
MKESLLAAIGVALNSMAEAEFIEEIRKCAEEATVRIGSVNSGHLGHLAFQSDAYARAVKSGIESGLRILAARRAAEKEAAEAIKAEANSSDSEYFRSDAFRADVIAELISEGCTRMQAEGRTRDQARLFAEAQRLELM